MTYPVVSRGRPGYPALLRELHDPPPRLYLRGAPADLLDLPAVAIVGARSCSPYGAQVAGEVAGGRGAGGGGGGGGLGRGGGGGARPGARAAGGLTVAVLGCGIDRDYPRAHAQLAGRIAESGAVVSEYPPGVEPSPWRFPARNRIVAGLARATVVVEARERSGALITADFALELGREVFAVPGEITSALSAGTNDLIRQGATPLLAADDVLEALGLERPPPRVPDTLSAGARMLLEPLSETARTLDELGRLTGLESGALAAALTELELAGLVASADGVFRSTTGRRTMA